MNKSKLKSYAPAARHAFIQAVTDGAHFWGLSEDGIEPAEEKGDVAIIAGALFHAAWPASGEEAGGANQAGGLRADHGGGGLHVVQPAGRHPVHGTARLPRPRLPGAEPSRRASRRPRSSNTPSMSICPASTSTKVIDLKLDGNKEAELYRMLLIAQCNALHEAMPFLFEPIDDETELLLPDNLLHSDSLIRKLVTRSTRTTGRRSRSSAGSTSSTSPRRRTR